MKSCVLALLLFLICLTSYAQRCAQLSMESIGGNKSEGVSDRVLSHSDGTFSLLIGGSSTSGNINTSCPYTFPSGGTGNIFYRRYNALGTTVLNEYCAPIGSSFYAEYYYSQTNGDTLFVGMRDTAGSSDDIAIERRNASGTVLWTKYFGGTGSDGLANVARATYGGLFIAVGTNSTDGDVGLHYGSGFDADIWILRVDSNGNKLWGKVLGGSGSDLPRDIKASPDGGCYVFGVTASTDHDAVGMKGASDLYVVKLDSLGQKEWHRCLGGTATDGCGYDLGIKAMGDGRGGFYAINRTNSHDGDVQRRLPLDDGPDFWLVHIDSLANLIWESTFGGPGWQVPSVFCRATDGSFWMGGQNLSSLTGGMIDATYGMKDAWVVHADTAGNFINSKSLGGDKEEYIWALHPLADASVLAIGRYGEFITPGNTSPGFPLVSEGSADIFVARLGPDNDLAISEVLSPDSWELFPNPPAGHLNVRTKTGDNAKYRVRILDATGRTVYEHSFRQKLEVATGGWLPGLYVVELSDEDGTNGTKKISIP